MCGFSEVHEDMKSSSGIRFRPKSIDSKGPHLEGSSCTEVRFVFEARILLRHLLEVQGLVRTCTKSSKQEREVPKDLGSYSYRGT